MCLIPTHALRGGGVPIGGFLPMVGIGLTDEFAGEFDPLNIFFAEDSDAPSGTVLGAQGAPFYDIALLDTGAAASLITTAADQNFNLDGPYPGESDGFRGFNTQTLGGATGFLEALISDPLGLYAGGLQGRLPGEGSLILDHDFLKGQTNSSILTIPPESDLPNVLGLTFASRYATYIRNDQPLIFQHDGYTVRTPSIDFLPRGSGGQGILRRAEMNLFPVQSFQTAPFFFNTEFGDNFVFHENPTIPTVIQGGLFLSVDVENDGNTLNNSDFFFDTGADVTVVSETTALELGFDVILDEPDFSVAVVGSGGTNLEVPGFFVDEFTIQSVGGTITANDVPIVVLNVPDPSGTTSNVAGIVGTNLLSGRNVVIDPEPQLGGGTIGPQLYISDPVTTEHNWNTEESRASWSAAASWDAGVPDILGIANVYAVVDEGDQAAELTESTTIWELNVAGTPDSTMTVEIQGGTTVTTFSGVVIEGGGTVHLTDAVLDAQFVEILGGTLSGDGLVKTGSGPIPGQVESRAGVVSPGDGVGTLEIVGRFASGVDNRLVIELAGAEAGAYDQVAVEGDIAIGGVSQQGEFPIGGTLDVSLVDIGDGLFEPAIGDRFEILTATGFLIGQFESLLLPTDFQWSVDYLDDRLALEVLAIAGDYNRNGIVDIADYNVWRDDFGSTTNLFADGNSNGVVEVADYNIWRGNFGQGLVSATSVPEPATVAILSVGLLAVAFQRRRAIQHAAA